MRPWLCGGRPMASKPRSTRTSWRWGDWFEAHWNLPAARMELRAPPELSVGKVRFAPRIHRAQACTPYTYLNASRSYGPFAKRAWATALLRSLPQTVVVKQA